MGGPTWAQGVTEANELTKAIHDRMPVILAPEAYGYLFKSIQDLRV